MAKVPVLSDFLITNRKTGFLWLGGERTSEDAGCADFHMEKSGQCDLIADSVVDGSGQPVWSTAEIATISRARTYRFLFIQRAVAEYNGLSAESDRVKQLIEESEKN